MAHYRTAQVCLNGHAITDSTETSPELMAKRCSECGAETITKCPKCQKNIRGEYYVEGVVAFSIYNPPKHCHECGEPYPWTQATLDAARELIDLTQLNDADKASLKNDLLSLLVDTPRTKVAATKMGQFLQKAGKEVGAGMREILVDVASEAAKKILFPGS